jgi:hypothetical protein
MAEASTVKAIEENMRVETRYVAECVVCGRETEAGDPDFATFLAEKGWRVRELSCIQTTGICCPNCALLNEEEVLKELGE